MEAVEKTPGFFDKRLAVCCAHNLSVCNRQIPHWQPAGGKLCEAFLARRTHPEWGAFWGAF